MRCSLRWCVFNEKVSFDFLTIKKNGVMMPWLSLSIWIPILFGVLVIVLGRNGRDGLARQVALIGSIIAFAVTIPVMTGFDGSTANLQFIENFEWLPSLSASYALGVDGISM